MDLSVEKRFPAKILLFGEHLVNVGGKGLAIPWEYFSGRLIINDVASTPIFERLLMHFQEHITEFNFLNLHAFSSDILRGLYFESNIPQGYGLGSSGALVASLYDKYSLRINPDFETIKQDLSNIESYFHGKSSAIDPLISYFNEGLMVNGNHIQKISYPMATLGDHHIFLLDTGLKRDTSSFVHQFLKKMQNDAFYSAIKERLIPATDQVIASFLEGSSEKFQRSFTELSRFQLAYLDFLIPPSFRALWISGLEQEQFALKICGAGGGGFLLGMAQSKRGLNLLKGKDVIWLE